MKSHNAAQVAVVGAGIVGLATAYTAMRQGKRVVVFEQNQRPVGASIRNFGMIWPIGQPPGHMLERALRSRQVWLDLAGQAGFGYEAKGSLHLAYHMDEWAVLEEFAATANEKGFVVELLGKEAVLEMSAAAQPEGLIGGLYSATEVIVDAREIPQKLIPWLREQGVQFRFGKTIREVVHGHIETDTESWQFDHVYVCSGANFETLFPQLFQPEKITKVKLQMMRTRSQPNGWRMGPALAAGLTLQHYAAFAHCPSLSALKTRIAEESPWFNEWGIHVMMSQNPSGELIIGDTHEYGWVHDPFLREDLNEYILDYLRQFARMPDAEITTRWHGVYAKCLDESTELIAHPDSQTTVVNGVGGAGMTLSFGLAQELVAQPL